jgi:hypothetical protein
VVPAYDYRSTVALVVTTFTRIVLVAREDSSIEGHPVDRWMPLEKLYVYMLSFMALLLHRLLLTQHDTLPSARDCLL